MSAEFRLSIDRRERGSIFLKICFLVSEYFRWGKFGGYGTSTRLLATQLVRRGFEVSVLTPTRGEQPAEEDVDGVTVRAYTPNEFRSLDRICRQTAADVYHSQEPSLATAVAMRAAPDRAHVVTCRDTRLKADWLIEAGSWIRDGNLRTLPTYPYENNPLVRRAVRRADAVFCPNEFSRTIAQRKFGLARQPGFLPSPVHVPRDLPGKADVPTVCHVGRWDSRKRPEIFFELAADFPDVRFVAMGQGRSERIDARLRDRYGRQPNLDMPGFVDQFSSPLFAETLSASWVLVNTALREGLPRTFMEAGGYGCAILSRVDPDGFASRFGYRTSGDDFANGLAWLLEEERWKPRGQAARVYVEKTYGAENATNRHVQVYESLGGSASLTSSSHSGGESMESCGGGWRVKDT